jgi:hypothetical protein
LQLWNCGNVDLNVTWSAQIDGRRLRVHAPAVEVPVDGGPVGATVTIEIPRGEVDVQGSVELEALSAADRRSWRVPRDRPQLVPRRRQGGWRGGRLAAGLLGVVAAVAGWLVFDAVRDGDGPVVVTDTAAPAPASAEPTPGTAAPSSEAPPDTTAEPGTPVPPTAARVFVAGDPVRELAIAVGQSGEVSFEIGNDGGSAADVRLGDLQGDDFFAIGPGTCGGPLEPIGTCSVAIVFEPAEPGTYETRLVVEDGSTGDELELSVTGIAGTIDLQVEFASDTVRTSGCPGDAPQCLAFIVFNAGTAASPATIAEVESGETVLRVDVPPLQPGAQRELLAGTGPSCTNDCGAGVAVDPDAVVPESDEENNEDTYIEVG